MAARIKIGISTYNDSEFLDMLLQSIDWFTLIQEPYDVVVCDDGSLDHHKKATREVCTKWGATLIEHEKNMGIPATWNHLAMSLENEAEIIVILNNDLLVVPQWLITAVHFLDSNKDAPQVGSMFWNPRQAFSKDMMKGMLPNLTNREYYSRDILTQKDPDFLTSGPHTSAAMVAKVGENQGLGRVMCPCGCCFAFRREVFAEVGPFREEMISFHEESDWGTRCAQAGKASFGFPYPRLYHTHSHTFQNNPELEASKRMSESRALYRQIWEVPDNVGPNDYFDYVNQRFMPLIPLIPLKYLRPDYGRDPVTYTLRGGEEVQYPALVEFTEVF